MMGVKVWGVLAGDEVNFLVPLEQEGFPLVEFLPLGSSDSGKGFL